jgi:exo-beta-1,3-glucanase (GH17 family)
MAKFGIDSNMVFDADGKSVATRLSDHDTQMAEKAKQSDLDAMKANSKYMLVYFCDTAYRQGTDYFTSFATNGKNAGFKEINILLHINSDGTTVEDITKFSQYSSIADSVGIPITCLKVHGIYSYPNYLTKLYSALAQLPHINTVFVFNEQFNSVYANGLTYPSQIKTAYPNVTKVGITVDYGTAFKSWLPTATGDITAIQNAYDILGVHMYPSCGSFEEAKNTTYEQCLKAFNDFQLTIPWQKELWLTESGVLPYWQFLELPESYILTPLTDQTRTIDPQRLFYRALFNSNFANRAKVIVPFYTESWMNTDTLDMWNVMKNIMTNRG